jgi:hypothetical protein
MCFPGHLLVQLWRTATHILQLVAIAKGPARLVQRRTSPDTAREILVQQPAVEKQVHGPDRVSGPGSVAQQLIPEASDLLPGGLYLRGVAITIDECHTLFAVRALAQQKVDLLHRAFGSRLM